MASLIDLRRRIRSVKNMRQIFRAMKMISAARLRRSQDKILATRPYALELRKITENLAAAEGQGGGDSTHPLLRKRPEKKVLLAVVSGDKGLCGSFNANVLRGSDQQIARLPEVEVLALGKRASDYHIRRNRTIRESYRSLFSDLRYDQVDEIATGVGRAFIDGEYDAVYVIYNQFVSVLTQKVTVEKVLPIEPEALGEGADGDALAVGDAASIDYLYEPSPEALLEVLLPRFLTFQFYRVLLESQAAEHAARMTAMDAATKNAGELLDRLTLKMNRARQAAITTELIEVVSGAAALG